MTDRRRPTSGLWRIVVAVVLAAGFLSGLVWQARPRSEYAPITAARGKCERTAELQAWEDRLRDRERALERRESALEAAPIGETEAGKPSSGASSDDDTAGIGATMPPWLAVPCRSSVAGVACSGHGDCDAKLGRCTCHDGFGGSDCGVRIPGMAVNVWDKAEDALRGLEFGSKRLASLVAVALLLADHESPNGSRVARVRDDIAGWLPGAPIAAAATVADALQRLRGAASGGDATAAASRPYVLVLDAEVEAVPKDAALNTLVTMMLTTDVDVLGFQVARRRPVTRRDLAVGGPASHEEAADGAGGTDAWSLGTDGVFRGVDASGGGRADGDEVLLPGVRHLDPPCLDLSLKNWQLRHTRAPFGYERHERYVMYCDRTSASFIMRSSPQLSWAYAGGLDGALTTEQPVKPPTLFNASLGSMSTVYTFAALRVHNDAVRRFYANATQVKRVAAQLAKSKDRQASIARTLAVLADRAPTRLPGTVMVGTCAECVIWSAVPRRRERLNAAFAEKFQVEIYHEADGRPSPPVCVKSGGIYGHSQRGLYSPICHRLQRQRDYLTLAKAWSDPRFAPLPKLPGGKDHAFGVSLHHGNLFGALRFNEELLWETDGDVDFIAFNATHSELMQRWRKLIAWAERVHGFTTKVNYPEKPWYVQFLKNKTDFQCNARSPRDESTRGRPPQVHGVSVDYQGRRAFMNGFSNPWRGIRSDPGHDYRGRYLAQQGWVLHFTKDSVSCKAEGHNACLPQCNAWWSLLDHSRCTDSALEARTRNPLLLYDRDRRDILTGAPGALLDAATGEFSLWERRHAGWFQ